MRAAILSERARLEHVAHASGASVDWQRAPRGATPRIDVIVDAPAGLLFAGHDAHCACGGTFLTDTIDDTIAVREMVDALVADLAGGFVRCTEPGCECRP